MLVEAPVFLPVNNSTLNISITNKLNRAQFSFELYPPAPSGVTITPESYSAVHGETFSINLEFSDTFRELRYDYTAGVTELQINTVTPSESSGMITLQWFYSYTKLNC